MSPLVLSSIIFVLMLGGILLGALLRTALPKHHLSKDSQDTVRLGVGLIATMAALVVGLLIAAAKSSYDTQSGEIRQITADLILFDGLLAQYGPEAAPIRQLIRATVPSYVDRIWREKRLTAAVPFEQNASAEKIYQEILSLSPQTDLQRSLQARAVQISTDLAQTRLLLFTQSNNSIPLPFLGVLAFWLIIIFASFSLFAALNATVFISLSLFAMSASCAIFLILELSEPFTGLLQISSAPLLAALPPLTQ
jgi:Protein of unknown function (DUF4239)